MARAILAELNVPETVTLPGDGDSVDVDVLCRLHNTSEDDHVVGSSCPDDVHNWHVLSETHREVTAAPRAAGKKPSATDVLPHVSQVIAAGHSHSAPRTLTLDARKLKPGKKYTVRYEFHGHVAEATFTALAGHGSTAKKPAAKKRTAKRPAGKKRTAKRPAAKQPVAKKPAAKKRSAK